MVEREERSKLGLVELHGQRLQPMPLSWRCSWTRTTNVGGERLTLAAPSTGSEAGTALARVRTVYSPFY